jgi:hypothetical protein
MNHLPQAPENNIRVILNFFENDTGFKILPPVPLVLLTSVAHNGDNIRLQTPSSELEGKNLYIC